jgi:hypothetical protein
MKTLEEIAGLGKNKVASVAAMVANIVSNDPSPHLKVMANKSYQNQGAISSVGKLTPKQIKMITTAINKRK